MAHSVIVSAVRTPFGRLGGGLAHIPATELGAIERGTDRNRAELGPLLVHERAAEFAERRANRTDDH